MIRNIVAALVATGCAPHAGGAAPMDPSRLAREPGWITAGATPDVRQRSLADCGAAALAMVAGRWNVAIAVPKPTDGLTLGALRTTARAYGLVAFAIAADRATLDHELRAGRPVIVGLLRPSSRTEVTSHYEVVVAERGDQVVTLDPAGGWRVRTWAALDAEWKPAKYPALVVLGPE